MTISTVILLTIIALSLFIAKTSKPNNSINNITYGSGIKLRLLALVYVVITVLSVVGTNYLIYLGSYQENTTTVYIANLMQLATVISPLFFIIIFSFCKVTKLLLAIIVMQILSIATSTSYAAYHYYLYHTESTYIVLDMTIAFILTTLFIEAIFKNKTIVIALITINTILFVFSKYTDLSTYGLINSSMILMIAFFGRAITRDNNIKLW
jgi:hypothetical protein